MVCSLETMPRAMRFVGNCSRRALPPASMQSYLTSVLLIFITIFGNHSSTWQPVSWRWPFPIRACCFLFRKGGVGGYRFVPLILPGSDLPVGDRDAGNNRRSHKFYRDAAWFHRAAPLPAPDPLPGIDPELCGSFFSD